MSRGGVSFGELRKVGIVDATVDRVGQEDLDETERIRKKITLEEFRQRVAAAREAALQPSV